MPSPRLRVTPPSWLRLPRRTARLRLTLLYGGLFLLSGAALLAITYLLFEQANPQLFKKAPSNSSPLCLRSSQGTGCDLVHLGAQTQRVSDLHHLLVSSGIALAIVAVLALLLGWFAAGRMLRPVRTITATARRISATNLHERLALDGADEEFKDLGDTLDDLFARLDAAFEAQRHFVANASHELRTPLTAERTLLQVALANPATTAERWRATGHELLASNVEQEGLIESLLALASSDVGLDHRERIDLSTVCESVLVRPDFDRGAQGLSIETAIRSAALDGDPRLIERLVTNLVDNAVGHNVNGGHVWVSTTVTDGRAVLSVTNTGPLIPGDQVDRLFQPFQRLEPLRTHHKDGHGLGLSIVRAIATAHDATVVACARPGGGLSVEVTFPPPTSYDQSENTKPGSRNSRIDPVASPA